MIRDLLTRRETVLQACWAIQWWEEKSLLLSDGTPLTVIFPGWLNRGPGPDFTNARLKFGDREVAGDVEIHLDERDWFHHGHHQDPDYGGVVLHVVAIAGNGHRPLGKDGQAIPRLEAGLWLKQGLRPAFSESDHLLDQYESLPGRCGLRVPFAREGFLKGLLVSAAEKRAWDKAQTFMTGMGDDNREQLLFEAVFQSLGYKPFAPVFLSLARQFPLVRLSPLFELPYGKAREAVLSLWMGGLGLLEGEPQKADGPLRDEFRVLQKKWGQWREPPLGVPWDRQGSRPWNSPERRLVGLFHHLYRMMENGLLKQWMAFFVKLDEVRHEKNFKGMAASLLDGLFETPDWEIWRWNVSFVHPPLRQAARMIGRDRTVILMANGVIPFFLAYARQKKDPDLEKLLYRLYVVLPPEEPNHKTRFMENRLAFLSREGRSLRSQQGLLQIYQDFCGNFETGCQDCELPNLIYTFPANG
ncbi:MAG: DUF2851 family protein [Deltaproteobacteria bacterium]|nr:DUF2851 family protein [Deltaproteobacteria bacterium]